MRKLLYILLLNIIFFGCSPKKANILISKKTQISEVIFTPSTKEHDLSENFSIEITPIDASEMDKLCTQLDILKITRKRLDLVMN